MTLEDGTELMLSASLMAKHREALKEGAMVKASFEEKGGQKLVTNIEVQTEQKKPEAAPGKQEQERPGRPY